MRKFLLARLIQIGVRVGKGFDFFSIKKFGCRKENMKVSFGYVILVSQSLKSSIT